MLFISLFLGFRNNGMCGCGVVIVVGNDQRAPKIAKILRLQRDDSTKSSVQIRPLAFMVAT